MNRAIPFLLALLAVVIPGRAEDKLAGGPYVVNVGPRAATVVWIVESGEASIGTDPGKLAKTGPVIRAEKVSFTGLQPGTTYYYDAAGRDGGKGSFKTAAAPNAPAAFEFVVFGDTRTGNDVHRAVIDAVLKHASPDFIIHTGDFVANGADSSLWPTFFEIERELLRKTALFPVLGNHEQNNQYFYEFFDQSKPYYSFSWGSCHFAVLDSNVQSAAASWNEQVRWLEDDLAKNQSAGFRFVIAHHPPLSAVARRQDGTPRTAALMPMFEKYKVTAGFFGHDHNYQHYLKNGVHYFVTGGGGAPLYDVAKPPEGITLKVASTANFILVKVNGKSARAEAMKPDGESLDVTELKSSNVDLGALGGDGAFHAPAGASRDLAPTRRAPAALSKNRSLTVSAR